MFFTNTGPFLCLRPEASRLDAFLSGQVPLAFTYEPQEGTRSKLAFPGYDRDMYQIRLGEGQLTFEQARQAVMNWAMFDLGWTRILQGRPDPAAGDLAVVGIRFLLWWVNSCRIVYVIKEPTRYGFAYGTLPGHVEAGEELFLVETKPDGSVWFEIHAFSRPRHWLTRLGYPLVRLLQKKFGRLACERILREINGGSR